MSGAHVPIQTHSLAPSLAKLMPAQIRAFAALTATALTGLYAPHELA